MAKREWWNQLSQQNGLITEEEKQIEIEDLVIFYFTNLIENNDIISALQEPSTQEFLQDIGLENLEASDILEMMNRKTQRDFLEYEESHKLKK